VDGDIQAQQDLIRLIEYSYQEVVSFFQSVSRNNLSVKRVWSRATLGWWPTEKTFRVHMSEDFSGPKQYLGIRLMILKSC
jgi:hypothetical protein